MPWSLFRPPGRNNDQGRINPGGFDGEWPRGRRRTLYDDAHQALLFVWRMASTGRAAVVTAGTETASVETA